MAQRRLTPLQRGLLNESKGAALNAVQTFNSPLTTFKTETFIVLIVIAWTYMLHAYYRTEKINYRYRDQKKKKKDGLSNQTMPSSIRYWDLTRCLNEPKCPLDAPTKANLKFLIGLRNEIEHHRSAGVAEQLSGRYLACCLNYETWIIALFGAKHSLGPSLSLALQFRDLTGNPEPEEAARPLPANVSRYISAFDDSVSEGEYQSPRFCYRLLFVRKLVNHRGQADKVTEFIPADSELEEAINKQYVVRKEVEREKHGAKQIVQMMHDEGFPRFSIYSHTQLWQRLRARDPGKGYGAPFMGLWGWYDRWLDRVRQECRDHRDQYGPDPDARLAG